MIPAAYFFTGVLIGGACGLAAFKPLRWLWHRRRNSPTIIKSKEFSDRRERDRLLGRARAEIVFLGDSLCASARWSEWLDNPAIVNRGINGETTSQMLDRIDDIAATRPRLVFIVSGTNDLTNGIAAETAVGNIVSASHRLAPSRVYVHTIPGQPHFNAALSAAAENVIDISNLEMLNFHPTAHGYAAWCQQLRPIIQQVHCSNSTSSTLARLPAADVPDTPTS